MKPNLVIAAILMMPLIAAAQFPTAPAELEAFVDPIFARVMERADIPGAVCAIIGPDDFLFLKGYGFTDLSHETPMDPRDTVVRVASVSKLFAATAVMQQIEQDNLRLDDPVNDHLTAFQLPDNRFGIPVTIRNLVTHTAGFDDRFLGMGAATLDALGPLGDYLARRLPPVVYPPGKVISYSNHGMALSGYLVEAVSGEPFAVYAQAHIFAPLGMDHTTYALPTHQPANWATGYMDLRGKRMVASLDYPQTVPASSLVTTASDMAKFMRAQLDGGGPLMKPETLALMQTQQFTEHPGLPGHDVAWLERYENRLRILEHGGLIWGFVSLVQIVPEKGVGIFISYNTQGGGLTYAVASALYDEYFPAPPEPRPEVAPEDTAPYAGTYRHARHTQTSIEKFATIAAEFIREIEVKPGAEPGVIRLTWHDSLGRASGSWQLAHAGNGLYRRLTDEDHFSDRGRVAFGVDPGAAKADYLYLEDDAYIRLKWYEHRWLLLGALAVSLGVALLNTLLAPLNALRRKVMHRISARPARRMRVLIYVTCVLQVAFAAGLGLFLWTVHPYTIGYGAPLPLVAVLTLPLVVTVLWAALLAATAINWRHTWWTRGLRLHVLLVLVATPVFLALLNYWNLFGYRFG